MSKKEQVQIAEILYELGMSFEVIEKITKIKADEILAEVIVSQQTDPRRE